MDSHGKELIIREIKEGTVIDHIYAGRALVVLKILGISGEEGYKLSILMYADSRRYGKKDLVKIENRYLTEEEVNKIALIAPSATINIIKNYKVVKKFKVKLPDEIENVVKCSNPTCITNSNEPIKPKFKVVNKNPVELRCKYCNRITDEKDILKQFLGEKI
ncbi:MAG: aspartate carbamoyltransferase regulatory subunit [Candidatus Njordarchaeia archaeon]